METGLLEKMERLQRKFKGRLKEMRQDGCCGYDDYEMLAWVINCIDGTLGDARKKARMRQSRITQTRASCPNRREIAICTKEPVNKECQFYDCDECRIGMDMTFCGRNCAFASNMPLSTPPYGSKYMRGGML